MANMNNVKFKFSDFNGFAIGMPPVGSRMAVGGNCYLLNSFGNN